MFQVIRRDYGLKLKDNPWLIAGILGASASHLIILYTPISGFFGVEPLSIQQWGYIAAALTVFATVEVAFRRTLSKKYGDRIGDFQEFHG